MEGCPFSRVNQEEAILRPVCVPCFRGQDVCSPLYNGENEQGNTPNRDAEKQLLPLRAKSTRLPCPPDCRFPCTQAQLRCARGVNCPCAVLHSGDVINVLLRDEFSQQHLKVHPDQLKQIADYKKRGPISLSASLGFPAVSHSSPSSLSCCACLRGAGAEDSKAPHSH